MSTGFLGQQKRSWDNLDDAQPVKVKKTSHGSKIDENGRKNQAKQSDDDMKPLKIKRKDGNSTVPASLSKPFAPHPSQSKQNNVQSTLSFAGLDKKARTLPWELVDMATGSSSRGSAAASTSTSLLKVKEEPKPNKAKPRRSANIQQVLSLSPEQLAVHNLVTDLRKSVFFTGSAGTGKSVLMRQIIKTLKTQYKGEDAVAVTASTGLAACNISGVTIHNFAGIGIGVDPVDKLVGRIVGSQNKQAASRWRRCKVLVIDEVSMLDGWLFDKLNEIAKKVRRNTLPFGGIQLVITGDFFQLPPVTMGGSQPRFAFEAKAWKECIEHTVNLTQVFRQSDTSFVDMLTEMRFGQLTDKTIACFEKLSRPLKLDEGVMPTELYPRRQEVENANKQRLRSLEGKEEKTFEAIDWVSPGEMNSPVVKNWFSNCRAPKDLTLRIGAQVMLTKNLPDQPELVNGTIGIVEGFGEPISNVSSDADHGLEEPLSTTDRDGTLAPYICWHLVGSGSSSDKDKPEPMRAKLRRTIAPFKFAYEHKGKTVCTRQQYPIILAWAMSIHKSQGQTLNYVKVDLGKVFECGQSYVALSRATSLDSLQVINFKASRVKPHDKVAEWSKHLEVLKL